MTSPIKPILSAEELTYSTMSDLHAARKEAYEAGNLLLAAAYAQAILSRCV